MPLPIPELTLANREAQDRARGRNARDRSDPVELIQAWPEFAAQTSIRSGVELLPFIPYGYQIKISDLIDRCRGAVLVKGRQQGLTELVGSKFLHRAYLHPTYLGAVFSKGQDDTSKIARRVDLMARSAGIELARSNTKEIVLKNGGVILFRTAGPDAGRGLESVWDLFFDEAAFAPGIEQTYSASSPAQSMPELQGQAKTVFASTPNSKDGLFYDVLINGNGKRDILAICQQMRDGQISPYQEWVDENNWGKAIVHWKAHPLYSQNPNYLEEVKGKKRLPEAIVQREYNLSFDDSVGGYLFNPAAITRQAVGAWAEPQRGRVYIFGIDPNFGGSDYFVCQVWDATEPPYGLVDQYRESGRSIEYSENVTLGLMDRYGPQLVAIETNSGGRSSWKI